MRASENQASVVDLLRHALLEAGLEFEEELTAKRRQFKRMRLFLKEQGVFALSAAIRVLEVFLGAVDADLERGVILYHAHPGEYQRPAKQAT